MNRTLLLVALALLWLAGCGGAAPPAAPSSAPPPASSAPAPAKPAASASAGQGVSAAASAKPAAGLTRLKGTYITVSPTGSPLWVARERGMFNKNGLDVSLTSVQATTVMPALMSNEIQLASSGAAEVAAVDLQGGNVVMVAEGAAMPIFSLFAEKRFKSVPELAGETIGVTSIGAASDTVAHLFLRKFGVEDKVKIAGAGGSSPAILAALSKGLLAGGILIPPVTAQAEQAGYVELVNGIKLGVPYTQGSLVMTRSYLKDHADVANRIIKSYLEAWTYVSNPANKADMIAIFQQYTKTDAKDSEIAYDFMVPLWQSQKVPYMSKEAVGNVLQYISDPRAKSADPTQFYDNSYLEAIAKAAGM